MGRVAEYSSGIMASTPYDKVFFDETDGAIEALKAELRRAAEEMDPENARMYMSGAEAGFHQRLEAEHRMVMEGLVSIRRLEKCLQAIRDARADLGK